MKYGIAFLILALAILVILPLTAIAEQSEGGIPMSSGSAQFGVHHVLLAQLGEEHLANAVLRRGTKSEHIVCWGDRILQWDVTESAEMVEVFSPIPRFQERTAEWNLPIPWTTLKAIGKSGGESICHHELKRPGDIEIRLLQSPLAGFASAAGNNKAH